jgi:hypothetical protein
VEQISQYIDKADVDQEFINVSETRARNRQARGSISSDSNAVQAAGTQTSKPTHSVHDHRRMSVSRSAGWLSAKSSDGLTISIPDTANRAVWLSRAKTGQTSRKFAVSLPNGSSFVNAKVAGDDSVVYTSPEQATDVAVQAFEDSARILTVLKGVDSPSEYSYTVTLPTGGKIEKMDNGAVFVLDSQGSMVGGFAAPWAVDNDGKAIPTHYEIRGNTVVQVVEHLTNNASYPVVADPWFGVDLISSASWAYDTKNVGWTLRVVPTTWAKWQAGGYLPGVAGWNELYSKYKNAGRGIKRNLNGMRDQYICHQQVVAIRAPNKPSWNLDEWRADVGYAATVNASCNPGNPGIFD